MSDQTESGSGMSAYLPDRSLKGSMAGEDLIAGLAMLVLEKLEAIEREGALNRIRAVSEDAADDETRQLLHNLDGLKERLKWIAGGM